MTARPIPYGHQDVNDADIEAVVAVLRGDFLTQGPAIPAFEAALAGSRGASHAVAVANGTAALHIACLALDLGPGDWLWTSPISFVASSNCALYCGASVDFVDIDPATANISVECLARKLEIAAAQGRLPKVVIPVHFAGQPCDMAAIGVLAERYGFTVIEDACHAVGATIGADPVGNCRHSAMTVFSFHPVKIVTTGEGGAITTNDPALDNRLRRLRSHGIERRRADSWEYEQVELGFNYRITDLQAALGSSQLTRIDDFVARRAALADRYDRLLDSLPVAPLGRAPNRRSAWHLYMVRLDPKARPGVYRHMRAAAIGVNVHYIPIYWQPHYAGLGFVKGLCPNAEAYYQGVLTLPLFPGLAEADQDRVVEVLTDALAVASAD